MTTQRDFYRASAHILRIITALFALTGVVRADWEEDLHRHAEQEIVWRNQHQKSSDIFIKLLGINDFHSQILTGEKIADRPVGSAPVLASYLRQAAKGYEQQTILLHAGDHVGASQPQSGLMQDEPGIMFFSMLGNTACTELGVESSECNLLGVPGNHELDEGPAEMMRLIYGGNHANGPFLASKYTGAGFPYVCANLVRSATNEPIFAPYLIKEIQGVRIAFIGALLANASAFLSPESLSGLTILDEVATVNQYARKLQAEGVHAIVLIIHQGGYQAVAENAADKDRLGGDIARIASQLDSEFDVIFSGHTHTFHNIFVENADGKNMLVVQAWPKGSGFADVDLSIDPVNGEVTAIRSKIVTTWADAGPALQPDKKIAEFAARVEQMGNRLASQVVAKAAHPITRTTNEAGESALGDLIADAQRQVMGTDFAFMQVGGIKADILPGGITKLDHFQVQPYNWNLIRLELTGQQIYDLLNQQWQEANGEGCFLQVSGLKYTWDAAQPAGQRVVEITRAGHPLDRTARYTVTVNEYLAGGGDNFTVLTGGVNPVVGPFLAEALLQYVQNQSQPLDSTIEGRISRMN